MFYRRNQSKTATTADKGDKNAPKSGRPQANFEDKWKFLQEGVDKLIEFLDADQKRPFDNNEYAQLYA